MGKAPRRGVLCTVTVLAGWAFFAAALGRDLSFEDRVKAQEAVERVYYGHTLGASKPFEAVVTRDVLERKVRRSLELSDALERFFEVPVTGDDLSAEMARIASRTRFPDRMKEIYTALGNDAFLIQETFVRGALVERAARRRAAPSSDADWSSWWAENEARLDPFRVRATASPDATLVLPAAASIGDDPANLTPGVCMLDDVWAHSAHEYSPSGRLWHVAVWTGARMIVWGGYTASTALGTGALYDPTTDTWAPMTNVGAPSARYWATAVWTGSQMIVWGGAGLGSIRNDGGRYDPSTDTWLPMATPALAGRVYHAAVWTGTSMFVWGGQNDNGSTRYQDGARYNPSTNSWLAMSTTGAPVARSHHSAVWTGSRIVVWGGYSALGYMGDGMRYDPATDQWLSLSAAQAPSARRDHTAVMVGGQMIVWGGESSSGYLGNGALYDDASNTWSPVSDSNAPTPRSQHPAIAAGPKMIVWGGGPSSADTNTGAVYTPGWIWTPLPPIPALIPRHGHTAVWTGTEMIVWGGRQDNGNYPADGGRYDLNADAWQITELTGLPEGRERPASVWTGNLMLVWSGVNGGGSGLLSGGRYDPLLDQWTPMSTSGAPNSIPVGSYWTGSKMLVYGPASGRYDPDADAWQPVASSGVPAGPATVWTGSRMITCCDPNTGRAGIYDPENDVWSQTSAGPIHYENKAVWTGSKMLVWGGSIAIFQPTIYLNTGASYDLVSNTWTVINTAGAPTGRDGSSLVWTGSKMIVWGGKNGSGALGDGGAYAPTTDAWSPIVPTAVASPREGHSTIWTGQLMLVWGGRSGTTMLGDGGRYDPSTSSWSFLTTTQAPSARYNHSAVWTGHDMIVWGGRTNPVGGGSVTFHDEGGFYGADEDGDGQGDSCDCAPADPANAPPAEITGLAASPGGSLLTWSSAPGEASVVYDVVRGEVEGLPVGSSPETCLASGLTTSTVVDGTVPATGASIWYLVRGRNACGAGAYGLASSGTPRTSAACP